MSAAPPTPKKDPSSTSPRRDQAWTVGELLRWTTARFEAAGIADPRVDAEHLLALALGCKRLDLYIQHDRLLDAAARGPFREYVRRRLQREPVAYIRGSRGFHALDLDLAVDRRVLIPRPDTEHLVDWLLEELPPGPGEARKAREARLELEAVENARIAQDFDSAHFAQGLESAPIAQDPERPEGSAEEKEEEKKEEKKEEKEEESLPVYVVDVGTGSGAIALAVKRARPDVQVLAIDREEDALAVAGANAERCGLEIDLRRGDLLGDTTSPPGGFHAIAANLPYIPSGDLAGLDPEVRDFEPRSALDGGADGLDLIRRLLDRCAEPGVLAGGGRLYLEIGIDQASAVESELRRRGFTAIASRRDYDGIERVIAAGPPVAGSHAGSHATAHE